MLSNHDKFLDNLLKNPSLFRGRCSDYICSPEYRNFIDQPYSHNDICNDFAQDISSVRDKIKRDNKTLYFDLYSVYYKYALRFVSVPYDDEANRMVNSILS